MPEIEYELRVRGPLFQDRDIAATFDREISATLWELGTTGQKWLQGSITPRGVSSGGGGLRGAMFTELRGMPANRSQIISNTMPYAPIVEVGRRPGKQPPVAPILLWTRRKLGLSGQGAIQAAFLIARKIGRRGTQGAFMFRQAYQRLAPYAQTQFQTCADRIATRLGGPA